MPEFSGLQIDPRCIKCGRPPTTDVPLYEMQNHLSICDNCRREEEQKGKRIAWVGGIQMEKTPQLATRLLAETPSQTDTNSLQKKGLFGMLGIPTTASRSDIEKGIGEKMRFWMREPNSDEKMQAIEQLRLWQEELISNPQFLQAQLDALQPIKPKPKAGGLHLGNLSIYTAQELLAACEENEHIWLQAEQLLRDGVLEHWIHFQLGNRIIAREADLLAKENIPTFRALNILFYRLMPERAFRFYNHEQWQALTSVPVAFTPGELASLCDQYWEKAEHHLYEGAMIDWLEHSQGNKGLSQYYNAGIKPYAKDRLNRGLGLELLLERCVPRITHPKLVVTFDGEKDEYTLEGWDREIPHMPVTIQVHNTTRGYTSVTLEIVNISQPPSITEPDWIYLADSRPFGTDTPISPPPTLASSAGPVIPPPPIPTLPVHIYGRLETAADRKLLLHNLEQLGRGKRYQKTLRMIERREYDQPPVVHEYPLAIKTMSYFQGFRGALWRWGLRGDIPGFFWNAIAGGGLAWIVLQILTHIYSATSTQWFSEASQHLTVGNAFLIAFAGAIDELLSLPGGNSFALDIAIMAGILGFFTGMGKGHTSYTAQASSQGFRKGARLFLVLCLFMLPALFHGYAFLASSNSIMALFYDGGSIIVCLLVWLIIRILVMIRSLTEKYLRTHYAPLLEPEGKEIEDELSAG